MSHQREIINHLFISKVRIKSLKYFFFHPDVPIHLRGAVRKLGEEINAVRRELTRMEKIKLLHTERRGNRKYFMLNKRFPFYSELLSIVHKTFGLGGEIIRNAGKLGDIQFALLTSSFTQGMRVGMHDIDMVLIGQVNVDVLTGIVERAEKQMGKEINYTVLKNSEFQLQKKRRDAFIMDLIVGNKIMLLGDQEDFLSA
ncbi:MAG TPA: hypothetical protein ENI23_07775 [bacterium]|nr:hypothetical protein [bacterium]